MGLNVKMADGKEGYFDTGAFLKDAAPGSSITDYDANAGVVKFKTQDGKDGSFNVKQMLADQGTAITGHGDFNTPVTAADSSPLSWKERTQLGLLTHESTDFQKMVDGISSLVTGNKQAPDANDASLSQGDDARALRVLKTRYEDAKVSNGNIVVKQNGVWKKADAPSSSIGQDAAQFLGSSGLSIMGAISGGYAAAQLSAPALAAGPAGAAAVAGATLAGAIGGAVLGETAKEATAVGIAGGHIDYGAAARDILTNGIMNMAGEVMGKGISNVVEKMVGRSSAEMAQSAAIQASARGYSESQIANGFKTVATTADSQVKDGIASAYSSINGSLSKAPLREAIDSADNMAKAQAYSRISRLTYEDGADGVEKLGRSMAGDLQTSLDNAYGAAQEKFGTVIKAIRNNVSDDFKIDLEQHLTDLKAAALDAPRDKRAFFDSLQGETADLIASRGQNNAVLEGKEAFDFNQRQFEMINNKLKATGAYDAQKLAGADDRLLYNAMEKTRSYLDDKRVFAAEHAGYGEQLNQVKTMYGQVKDALDAVWSKSYSNKRDMTFAQNVAKGSVDANVKEALNTVHGLVPEAGIADAISNMRLKQAGIEMSPIFKAPDLIHGAGGAAAAVKGGPLGIALAPAVASPRLAAAQARAAASTGEVLTKNALVQALPAARAQASALLGMAHSAGYVQTLGAVGQRALLTNPDLFKEFMQKSSDLSHSLSSTTDDAVMNKAIQLQQQRQGGH